jgi:hypothetical protein
VAAEASFGHDRPDIAIESNLCIPRRRTQCGSGHNPSEGHRGFNIHPQQKALTEVKDNFSQRRKGRQEKKKDLCLVFFAFFAPLREMLLISSRGI